MYLDTVRRLTVRGRHYLNNNTIIPTAKCYLPKLNKFRKYLSFEEVREKEKTPDIQTLSFHYHDTSASPQVGDGLGYSALVADVDVKRCVLGHSDGRGLE